MRILVAEDDRALQQIIALGLRDSGYHVDTVDRGDDAIDQLRWYDYDVAVIDWRMPGKEGIDVVAWARRNDKPTALLLLTARDAPADRIRGLDMGADDYLVKPFDFGELLARVRALQRRPRGVAAPILEVGRVRLDPARRSVEANDSPLNLTSTEYLILELLMRRAPAVVDRKQIAGARLGRRDRPARLERDRRPAQPAAREAPERGHPNRHGSRRRLPARGRMSVRRRIRLRRPRLSEVTRRSLRVAFATTAIVAIVYAVAAGAVFGIQTKNLNDQIDYRLSDFVHHGGRGPGGNSFQPSDDDSPFDQIYYWLIDNDGSVVFTNSNVSTLPAEYQQVVGWNDGTISDTQVRLYGQQLTDGYLLVAQSVGSVADAQSQLLWAELAITPVLLVVVFVGAVVIGRRVATPVERARRRQLEFTADASHELRTPLSVIEANTSLALTQPRDEQWYQEAFLRVDSESKRMRRLLEDMLWLARFDATRGTPHAEPVDVAVLAGATADRFSAVAEARQLRLTVESSVPDAVINVPPEWLDRLLGVLLDNALKFSTTGGVVRVSVGLDGARVQLTVDDSGPGIPEAERSRVFDRFHRGTESTSGAGLGLAIADAIVRVTDGRWRIGTSPQGGASLSVSWPRAFAGPRDGAVKRSSQGTEHTASPTGFSATSGPES